MEMKELNKKIIIKLEKERQHRIEIQIIIITIISIN